MSLSELVAVRATFGAIRLAPSAPNIMTSGTKTAERFFFGVPDLSAKRQPPDSYILPLTAGLPGWAGQAVQASCPGRWQITPDDGLPHGSMLSFPRGRSIRPGAGTT